MSQLVLREDDQGLCILSLNRPDALNALSPNLFIELRAHIDALANQTETIGCVILCGKGRSFSAGNDLKAIQSGEFDEARPGDHAAPAFAGYGNVPVGAQTPLRLSQTNLTAAYARSGFQLRFEDPAEACTGCSHCVTNCPEGIIFWKPDEKKGMVVTGVDVSHYCKLCGECVAVCPEHLFKEVAHTEEWEEVLVK